ncbi:MAG: hypothetical protein R3B55_02980 [Candidatus Paceibacterota bacterium]
MSIENPEKPKMKIVHFKDLESKINKKEDLDFSGTREITPEFMEKIEFYNPMRQKEKVRLFNIYKKETRPEIKKHFWDALVEFVLRTQAEEESEDE